MKLKQKEILLESKHQELDVKEERCVRELDQLTQSEQCLCDMITAAKIDIIPGRRRSVAKERRFFHKLLLFRRNINQTHRTFTGLHSHVGDDQSLSQTIGCDRPSSLVGSRANV